MIYIWNVRWKWGCCFIKMEGKLVCVCVISVWIARPQLLGLHHVPTWCQVNRGYTLRSLPICLVNSNLGKLGCELSLLTTTLWCVCVCGQGQVLGKTLGLTCLSEEGSISELVRIVSRECQCVRAVCPHWGKTCVTWWFAAKDAVPPPVSMGGMTHTYGHACVCAGPIQETVF